mgnify:CR=1 FL=1
MAEESEGGAGARRTRAEVAREFRVGLARAFGGAILFSLPMLMTMELWWLGFYMDRLKLALLVVLDLPLLVGLSYFSGFRETETWVDDVVDAFVAIGVGFVSATAMLLLMNIIGVETALREITGKVTLLAVPASIGAILASSEFGQQAEKKRELKQEASYAGELFFMLAGAVFFAASLAPTEEMVLIAYKMTSWHGLALALFTLVLIHAFVYEVDFRNAPTAPQGTPWWSLFLRFTVAGYALALLVSGYILWTFDRLQGHAVGEHLLTIVVLGFPAGIGASVARVLL